MERPASMRLSPLQMNQIASPSSSKSTGLAPIVASGRICHCLKVLPCMETIRSLEGTRNQTVPSGSTRMFTPETAWPPSVE